MGKVEADSQVKREKKMNAVDVRRAHKIQGSAVVALHSAVRECENATVNRSEHFAACKQGRGRSEYKSAAILNKPQAQMEGK